MVVHPDLKARYEAMGAPPEDADAVWKRERGYELERVLRAHLTAEGLDPRGGYKTEGEQIDGSFVLDGSVYLLEAKWHADPQPASTLYQFKGKVDGKLVGTIGVFISMSGFSDDAVDALTVGKSLNVILFDKADMDAAIAKGRGFKNILRLKLRKAAEEALAFFPAESKLLSQRRRSRKPKASAGKGIREPTSLESEVAPDVIDLMIISESQTDLSALGAFTQRILDDHPGRRIMGVQANGKLGVPGIANSIVADGPPARQILVVVDSDGDLQGTQAFLQRGMSFDGWLAAIAEPDVEAWLGLGKSLKRVFPLTYRATAYANAAKAADLGALRTNHPGFDAFYRAVAGLPGEDDAEKGASSER